MNTVLKSLQRAHLASRGVEVSPEYVERIISQAYDRARADRHLDRLLSQYTGLSPLQVRHLCRQAAEAVNLSLSPGSVHIDTALPNFLAAYENRECIADEVLPVLSVRKRSDKVFEIPVETLQQVADVQIAGQRGKVKEISYGVNTNNTYSVVDYGLMDFVSSDEEENADAPLVPRAIAAMVLTSFLDLAREIRVAAVVFGSGNFGSNTAALSGTDRFDNSASDPVQKILDAIESCFVRPNTMVVGGQVWPKLINNPAVVAYIKQRASDQFGATPRIVNEDWFARAFGLSRVKIGRAKYVSSAEGASITSSYIWGKSLALIKVEDQPNPRMTSCFGYTYRFGSNAYQSEVVPDRLSGVRGGNWIKLTHSDDEKAVGGGNAGYLYTTVIS